MNGIDFEYTEDMNEITGLGSDYERGCRTGVLAGMRWVIEHPGAEPAINGYSGEDGWLQPQNMAGTSLLAAIEAAPFTLDNGTKLCLGELLTPNQYLFVLQHIGFIAQMGWDAYAQKMRTPVSRYDSENYDEREER